MGHGLVNDLQVLDLFHPYHMIRDTSVYVLFMRRSRRDGGLRCRRLVDLAKSFLGVTIQNGEHSSVEDAAAAMSLYQLVKDDWDEWVLWAMNGAFY